MIPKIKIKQAFLCISLIFSSVLFGQRILNTSEWKKDLNIKTQVELPSDFISNNNLKFMKNSTRKSVRINIKPNELNNFSSGKIHISIYENIKQTHYAMANTLKEISSPIKPHLKLNEQSIRGDISATLNTNRQSFIIFARNNVLVSVYGSILEVDSIAEKIDRQIKEAKTLCNNEYSPEINIPDFLHTNKNLK